MKAISIVIPVYNVEKYLRRSLNTVIDQTFRLDYEIICVDDGSTDNSPKILEEYAQKYPGKFKMIRQENRGLSCARNTAMEYVTGKYTVFVDADDFIALNMLDGLYKYAESNNSEVVVFDFFQGREGQKIPQRYHYENLIKKYGDFPFNAATADPFVYKDISYFAWSKFYLTDFVKNIKFEPGLNSRDVCHWAEVFTKAKRINYLPVPYYFNVCGSENAETEDKGRKLFDVFEVFKKTEKAFKESGYFEKYKDVIYNFFAGYLVFYIEKINPEFRREFIETIKNYDMEINYDRILNGNYLKYEKDNIYLIKLIRRNDFETVEKFCFEKRIWTKEQAT